MSTRGGIVKVTQDEYDDGIMDLVIEFDNGDKILQKWRWCEFNSEDAKAGSLHDRVMYDWDGWDGLSPDDKFTLIQLLAEQVDGPVLKEED